jgi:tetratricopeptide (TPR) repeat protein
MTFQRRPFPVCLIALAAAALFAEAPASLAADVTPTIADVTQHNEFKSNKLVIIKTPSILDAQKAAAAKPDPKIAIENYDKLLQYATDPQIRAESLRRSADLRLQLADADGNPDPAELKKAIASYTQLLKEQPDYALNDRVLYQLARAEQGVGEDEPAIDALRKLGRDYPDSQRVADAHFRAAELLFRSARYAEAEPEYRAIVEHQPNAPFFEAAQYKLGWSLYKQEKHDQAVSIFLALLDRDLPQGELRDPKAALAAVDAAKRERVEDALRVTGLAFAALGGGDAMNHYFAQVGKEPRFSTLLYSSLGDGLLEKHRYSDAAGAYLAFSQRHPKDLLAPEFQHKAIEAYRQGGFEDLMVAAKQHYAEDYAPGAAYWSGRTPTPEVLANVRADFDDLGRYYHAHAQARPAADDAAKRADFLAAADWYRHLFTSFPQDPQLPEVNLRLADALYDGGQLREAAEQYEKTAYAYGKTPQAAEAANAAVQADEKLAEQSAPADRPAALRLAVASAAKLADAFPQHPQRNLVLARAAEDLFELKDYPQALAMATRVLQSQPPAPADLQLQALAVTADTQFALNQYPQAEVAYTQLLQRQSPNAPARAQITEQLAAAIYKQGEAARSAGDLKLAARDFQRVGEVAPDAKLRGNSDYDAASAFVELQDWPSAERSLESIRNGDQNNPLLGDVDKKLALAYQKDGKAAAAAAAYSRVAQRGAESTDTRREAAWLAAQLYDGAGSAGPAAKAYEAYVNSYPQPLDRGIQARRRLADYAHNSGDDAAYSRWLKELVAADSSGGAASTDATHQLAAQASLDLGRLDAQKARALVLSAPLDKSLALRKAATEAAIASLGRAAEYRYAEIKTAAAYEIGAVYRDFAEAIVGSQRPGNLKGESLDQYNLLLQEQADAFDDKSIAAHAANLQSLKQGVWNVWIHRSADQLAQLAPAVYGKHEQHDDRYGSLH